MSHRYILMYIYNITKVIHFYTNQSNTILNFILNLGTYITECSVSLQHTVVEQEADGVTIRLFFFCTFGVLHVSLIGY